MQSIDDLEVLGRRVPLRSDLNVPLDLTGRPVRSPTTAGSGPACR